MREGHAVAVNAAILGERLIVSTALPQAIPSRPEAIAARDAALLVHLLETGATGAALGEPA